MIMPPKVLIGCPTYDGKDYCLPEFIRSLQRLSYSRKTIYFVDTSEDESNQKKIQHLGFECDWVPGKDKTRIERIIHARNRIREKFLETGYDYLFFLDADLIVQKNAIEKLLEARKEVITGVYIIPKKFGEKIAFIPAVFGLYSHPSLSDGISPNSISNGITSDAAKKHNTMMAFPYGNGKMARIMTKQELEFECVKEICFAGLGYCLIKRNALEKIMFRREGSSDEGGEDIAFFMDAKEQGFIPYVHTGIGSLHMVYPKGRRENQFLLFKIRPKPMALARQ